MDDQAIKDKTRFNESFQKRNADRLKRLRDLHIKRNESRQLNFQAVLEEEKNKKMPANWEARKQRAEWILNDDEKRKCATENGYDYDRLKLLDITATEAEVTAKKKKRKYNPDQGFADFEQATARQYNRLIKNIKPNFEEYEHQKEKMGGAFYGDRNTILHGLHKDTKEGIDSMVEDLEKQIAKREKYSRRRAHNDDADIDYINERNMKFNKKLERFYGEHTLEIKQNLERGTAV